MEQKMATMIIAFLAGTLVWPVSKILTRKLIRSKLMAHQDQSRIYGLEHGVLNSQQPSTMWMNVGYWQDQMDETNDFPRACRNLLEAVIQLAFGHQDDQRPIPKSINLLDVGFGCGDQTLHLLRVDPEPDDAIHKNGASIARPAIRQYIGITNNASQCSYARRRLKTVRPSADFEKTPGSKQKQDYELYCEDAALPDKWSSDLRESMREMIASSKSSDAHSTWLLALDTMYHFNPSRLPLLQYANCELNASFMAFDYLLADDENAPSAMLRILLRLICSLTSAPFGNFLTQKQYRQMLMKAGYREDGIEIKDISEFVFEPLSRFLARQDGQLRSIGLGIGAFHVARWIFSWWGSSGIVRGCIVVARQKKV